MPQQKARTELQGAVFLQYRTVGFCVSPALESVSFSVQLLQLTPAPSLLAGQKGGHKEHLPDEALPSAHSI